MSPEERARGIADSNALTSVARDEIEDAIRSAALEEREACARLAEDPMLGNIAAAIRARKP